MPLLSICDSRKLLNSIAAVCAWSQYSPQRHSWAPDGNISFKCLGKQGHLLCSSSQVLPSYSGFRSVNLLLERKDSAFDRADVLLILASVVGFVVFYIFLRGIIKIHWISFLHCRNSNYCALNPKLFLVIFMGTFIFMHKKFNMYTFLPWKTIKIAWRKYRPIMILFWYCYLLLFCSLRFWKELDRIFL